MTHHGVELVAMNDQQPLAVGCDMDEFVGERHHAEIADKLPQEFIVIARGIVHLGTAIQELQDAPHD